MYQTSEKFEIKTLDGEFAEIIGKNPGGQSRKETEYTVIYCGHTFDIKESVLNLLFSKLKKNDLFSEYKKYTLEELKEEFVDKEEDAAIVRPRRGRPALNKGE
jgi:hypothetical protein